MFVETIYNNAQLRWLQKINEDQRKQINLSKNDIIKWSSAYYVHIEDEYIQW